jgi:hypothetical protein
VEQADLLRRVIDVLEDREMILGKLWYYREGGSEKHLRDIADMLQVSGDEIDTAYVDAWSGKLGLAEERRMVFDRLHGRE